MITDPGREGKGKESGKDASANQNPNAPPALSLPKGGGAIRGIGEKFAANPVTGTGSMTIPIATSPGRSGFGPPLSLSYDSGSGNSSFGFGWNLPLPAITRKTDKGLPQYRDHEESDIFILSGVEELAPEFEKDAGDWVMKDGQHVIDDKPVTIDGVTFAVRRYRPRIEGLFARIERWTNQAGRGDCFWRSISKDNITTWYGKTNESRIADPADPARIFSWLVCESYDDKGNAVRYEYKAENSDGIDVALANERNRTRTAQRPRPAAESGGPETGRPDAGDDPGLHPRRPGIRKQSGGPVPAGRDLAFQGGQFCSVSHRFQGGRAHLSRLPSRHARGLSAPRRRLVAAGPGRLLGDRADRRTAESEHVADCHRDPGAEQSRSAGRERARSGSVHAEQVLQPGALRVDERPTFELAFPGLPACL